MIRLLSIVVLLTFITGCVSTFKSFSGNGQGSDSARFDSALKKLETNGDPSELKALAKDRPDSRWADNARTILNTYTAQQKKIKALKKKNASLTQENKKLKNNLDKLNKINLEMEKRSP